MNYLNVLCGTYVSPRSQWVPKVTFPPLSLPSTIAHCAKIFFSFQLLSLLTYRVIMICVSRSCIVYPLTAEKWRIRPSNLGIQIIYPPLHSHPFPGFAEREKKSHASFLSFFANPLSPICSPIQIFRFANFFPPPTSYFHSSFYLPPPPPCHNKLPFSK